MRTRVLVGLMAAIVATMGAGRAVAQDRDPIAMPVAAEDSIMKHIIELSSERYEGRLAGSKGYDAAAQYVEEVLMRYGISVMEQEFPIECNVVENCKFNTYRPGSKDKRVFTLGNEFVCAGVTGRGYVDAQMVFVGYGIDDEFMNEYADVDVQGKIVIVLTGMPGWVPEAIAKHHTTLRDKARTAERHGALGMLAINLSPSVLPYVSQSRVYCGEIPHQATFPLLHLTLDCGREIMQGEMLDLDAAMSAIEGDHKAHSFSLLQKAEVDVNALYRAQAPTVNVIGMLRGSDRRYRNELIVVGASLDHAGMQGETALFPGADINASGVAAVLEAARLLSQPQYRPRRSVLFVLFSGSEQQFMGSRRFLEMYPRSRRIEAFVNIQNIGCGDSIVVLGDNHYPTLHEMALVRDSANLSLIHHFAQPTDVRGDARVFDYIGIPSMVFTTLNGMQHNHVASDIWENINRPLLTNTTQVMVETVRELADGIYQGRSKESKRIRL
jgi:hypothetical protein